MRNRVICRGLPGFWVNGWLAGVGATVLCPKIRLGWTEDRTPRAILSSPDGDPAELLSAAWPTRAALEELPIAEDWANTQPMERKVELETFSARVRAARAHPESWALSSTMTDLHVNADGDVAHAPFDPAGPGPTKWLHDRLVRVHRQVRQSAGLPGPSPGRLARSLQGTAARVPGNGLGFDITRLGSQADQTATCRAGGGGSGVLRAGAVPGARDRHGRSLAHNGTIFRYSARLESRERPQRATVQLAGMARMP